MQLRRAAQAIGSIFSPPLKIQNGNSIQNFSASPRHHHCCQFDKKFSSTAPTEWNFVQFFQAPALRFFLQWIIFSFSILTATFSGAQSGLVRNIAIVPKNDSTGAGTIYFISFEADSGLDRDDKISLYFPKGKFDISGALAANNQSGLDGGFVVTQDSTVDNDIVGIERDGHGVDLPPNTPGSFRLAIIGNPTKPGTYTITIITLRNGVTPLNQGEDTVTINPGPLDHFSLSTIANKIANDFFSFRITAKDFYNNNTRAYSGNIQISDYTGTLTPSSIQLNDTAVTVGGAQITKAQKDVKIIASAFGKSGTSNSFNVNQIKILALENATPTVSPGQQNIQVKMTVQNLGPDNVSVTSANLAFTNGASNDNSSYDVTLPALPVSISGNLSTKILIFTVRAKPTARTGSVTIDGSISGTVLGAPISATGVTPKPSWTVQAHPRLSYVANPTGLFPKQVIPGGFFEFQVPIKNINNAATLELKPDSTTFKFSDDNNVSFVAKLDANRGTKVFGSDTTTLTFRRGQIPANMDEDKLEPQVRLIGTHNGARLDTLLILPTDELEVGEKPPLQIVDITASQDTVTQDMKKTWTITLRVRNNSTRIITLQNTELSLVKMGPGGKPDTGYKITHPTQFTNSGTNSLAVDDTDFLEFQITETGKITGALAVFAKVFVNELTDPAESNGTQKNIVVQTPANLRVSLRTSQPTVTINQTRPWKVIMTVKNSGESAAKAIFDPTEPDDSTRTSLSNKLFYTIAPETTEITIAGQDSTPINFVVTNTQSIAKIDTIDGQVYAREINSGVVYFAATDNSTNTQIIVQSAATVSIDSTVSVGVRGNTVSIGQKFQIKVKVKKTGEEPVDTVRVRLTTNRNSTIAPNIIAISNPALPAIFDITTGSGSTETFTASIEAARSGNTRAYTVQTGNPNIDRVSVTLQNPAKLSMLDVQTSESVVRGGRTQPWFISVVVRNSGAAPLVVDSSRIIFKIGAQEQKDYVIEDSTQNSGLIIAGGKQDTLIYRVKRTGSSGGAVRLVSTVDGHDQNSDALLSANHQTTTFTVETTALVKIISADFPATMNRLFGTDVALVDTAQTFNIEVTVENTGQEVVDTAYVSLETSGLSKILNVNRQAHAANIGTIDRTAKAIFMVRADNAVNSLGETFTARLDFAVTKNKVRAALGKPVDSTAVVRIELPARLQLSLALADGGTAVGRGQQFKMRARVKNLGQAQTDKNGMVELKLPANNRYSFAGNETAQKNFAAGDSVEWNILAPTSQSLQDVFTVAIDNLPIDKNSGQPAMAVNNSAQLTISTLANALNIAQVNLAPAGASDRIISTDQIFTVTANIQTSSNLTNKTVTLMLPAGSGYRFVNGDSATKKVIANSVSWQAQAPSIENLNPFKLPIEANAFDGQNTLTDRDTLVIRSAEKQAILQIEPGIKEAGAQSGVVSINQNFTFVAKLRNTGRALAAGAAKVRINLPPASTITLLEPPSAREKSVVFDQQANVREITWRAKASNQPTSSETITFEITQRPSDMNTGIDVLTSNDPAQFNVTTVATGIVSADPPRLASPPGAIDLTLSTSQEFTVSDTLRWINAANISAELVLPPGSNFTVLFGRIQNIPNPGETGKTEISWIVRAPVGPLANVQCRVLVKAKDSHDSTLALAQTSEALQFNVVQRAELSLSAEVTEPPSAVDRVLSVGQSFTIVAKILNVGVANVDSVAQVSLKFPANANYQLFDPQDSLRRVIIFPGQNTCSWRVQARTSITDDIDLITLRLTKPPRDENTNSLAAVNDAETELAVRTEGRKLVAETADKGGGPAVRGQKNLLLLRVQLTNPAGPNSSNLMLQALNFDLRSRDGDLVPPNAAITAMRVVNDSGRVVGSVDPVPTNSQSLQVSLSNVMLVPDNPDTVSLFVDIADNATARTFRLAFDNSQDFTVADQDGGYGAVVETPDGKRGNQFRLESNLAAIHGADLQSSFFNYPNPFQPGNDPSNGQGTRFNLPAGANGELKIFTLLGELVWEIQFEARNPLASQGIFWNGHNGAGKRVLNGVYVAMLKTNDGKMLTTKVAVLKK